MRIFAENEKFCTAIVSEFVCTDPLIQKRCLKSLNDTVVNFAGTDRNGNCVSVTDGDGYSLLIFHYHAAL